MRAIWTNEKMTAQADDYLSSIIAQVAMVQKLPPNVRAYLVNDLRRADDSFDSRPWCEATDDNSDDGQCPDDVVTVVAEGDVLRGVCQRHAV